RPTSDTVSSTPPTYLAPGTPCVPDTPDLLAAIFTDSATSLVYDLVAEATASSPSQPDSRPCAHVKGARDGGVPGTRTQEGATHETERPRREAAPHRREHPLF